MVKDILINNIEDKIKENFIDSKGFQLRYIVESDEYKFFVVIDEEKNIFKSFDFDVKTIQNQFLKLFMYKLKNQIQADNKNFKQLVRLLISKKFNSNKIFIACQYSEINNSELKNWTTTI